jgi:hypothetical protein
MKRIIKYLLMVLLAAGSIEALSQNVLDQTRNFTSLENIDLYSNLTVSDTFTISLNSSSLVLTNAGLTRTIPVSNVAGTWTDINLSGELTFNILVKDFLGSGSIRRQDGVLTVTIDLSGRKDWMKREFIINEQ